MKTFRQQYNERRAHYATKPKGESKTDQSQRNDCDLNIIVRKHMPGTVVAGGNAPPIYGADLSNIPRDLADAIHTIRNLDTLRGRLPQQFKDLAIDDLLELTPDAIHKILTPAETPPTKKEGET